MGRRNRPIATTLLIISFADTPIQRLSCGITQDNSGITETVAFKETALGEIHKKPLKAALTLFGWPSRAGWVAVGDKMPLVRFTCQRLSHLH